MSDTVDTLIKNKYDLARRLGANPRYANIPLSDLITDLAGEVDSIESARSSAQRAADEVEREGLGAFLDGCPSDAFSTVDESPTRTVFVFEDGSRMTVNVASVSWRSS